MELKVISAQDTLPLRQLVLRPNQPEEACYFNGDYLKNTYHLGAFLDQILVGIVSLMQNEKVINDQIYAYQLRGMAVLPNFQGKKVGSFLLEGLPAFLLSKKIEHIWCNARQKAIPFYKKFGFRAVGIPFIIPEVGEHILMTKAYA